ncbi:MAG: hypothetical protein JRJ43_09710 [Deltaproteobacteria bacterium]|nr:hypothetical protein [Deltaproteobacteria bacterium]
MIILIECRRSGAETGGKLICRRDRLLQPLDDRREAPSIADGKRRLLPGTECPATTSDYMTFRLNTINRKY